jgi:hypothetical protein
MARLVHFKGAAGKGWRAEDELTVISYLLSGRKLALGRRG